MHRTVTLRDGASVASVNDAHFGLWLLTQLGITVPPHAGVVRLAVALSQVWLVASLDRTRLGLARLSFWKLKAAVSTHTYIVRPAVTLRVHEVIASLSRAHLRLA